jgi:hypothetical protein
MGLGAFVLRAGAVPATVVFSFSVARAAHAEGNASAQVTAEALFAEGRRLMGDGKANEACPKFADSERLDPSPGTLLNLANCYEKQGRSATAWATYREAVSLGASVGRQDLVAAAERHASSLEPSLSRVSVTASAAVDGLSVALDGLPIGSASWGLPLPVDPGEHVVSASAPGRKPWSTKITISVDTKTTPVSVPELEVVPASAPPVAPTASPTTEPAQPASVAAPAASVAPVNPAVETSAPRTQRTIAWIVGGAGVVGVVIGTGFTFTAKSKYDDSLHKCDPGNHNSCDPSGVAERNTARSDGNVATVAMGLGLAAVAGGVVIWLTSPSASSAQSASVGVSPSLGGAMVSGRW